jgi:hypothetical protein
MHTDSIPRDDRYRFQGFDPDFLTGLGRLLVGGSFLEGSASVLLARLIRNNDDDDGLALGHRLTANATFPCLLDHIRAISELRFGDAEHQQVVAWTKDAETAYSNRSRIVHADWGVDATGDEITFVFMRRSARTKVFTSEDWPATAGEVHKIARELERVGLAAGDLMQLIPKVAPG